MYAGGVYASIHFHLFLHEDHARHRRQIEEKEKNRKLGLLYSFTRVEKFAWIAYRNMLVVVESYGENQWRRATEICQNIVFDQFPARVLCSLTIGLNRLLNRMNK